MKIKFLFVIFVLTSLLLGFSSCSKNTLEDKLIGDWEQKSVGQIPDNVNVVWTFTASHSLYRTTQWPDSSKTDTAQWSAHSNFMKKNTLRIENLDEFNNGKYIIHRLTDFLEIQRTEFPDGSSGGAFKWHEFEKK